MSCVELKASDLFQQTDPRKLKKSQKLTKFIGQDRAAQAFEFGLDIDQDGFHIFVVGPRGTGRESYVLSTLRNRAKSRATPDDLIYVPNFSSPTKSTALFLPAGKGVVFQKDFEKMLNAFRKSCEKDLSSRGYQKAKSQIIETYQEYLARENLVLQKAVNKLGFAIVETEGSSMIVPMRSQVDPETGKKVMVEISNSDLSDMTEEEQTKLRNLGSKVRQLKSDAARRMSEKENGFKTALIKLESSQVLKSFQKPFQQMKTKYQSSATALQWLKTFWTQIESGDYQYFMPSVEDFSAEMGRYSISVVVSRKPGSGAPVVCEPNPTFYNLSGKVEYELRQGQYGTDLSHIVAGALHKAQGGYLVLDAELLLREPYTYEMLKRTLRNKQIVIDMLGEQYAIAPLAAHRPQPVPFDGKVILIGTHRIYYLLREYDPEFEQLFQMVAEFDDQVDRNEQSENQIASWIEGQAKLRQLLPFSVGAMAEIIQHGSRLVEDRHKVSLQFHDLLRVMIESHQLAVKSSSKTVEAAHVLSALDQMEERLALTRTRFLEQYTSGVVHLDLEGTAVGQINGLAVVDLGDCAFGYPARITATTFMGKDGVVNIERETNMSGPIHTKGLLTLSGYFGYKYAQHFPLGFGAQISFEQNYGGIDGDSASSAEIYCLLSSVSKLPLRQDLAVTGSVDQHGRVQAIGGVNEKIEGFFDYCNAKGLTGTQGVMIPSTNVQHLNLHRRVREAVQKGHFHIYAVSTIDEGIELLTGVVAGTADQQGRYAQNSVHGKVQAQLRYWSVEALHQIEQELESKSENKKTSKRKRAKS